jgi:hypothetical protein
MPRSTREWALRKLDMSINNLEWCDKHLLEVVEKYLDVHPEIAAPLSMITEITESVKTLITSVREKI